MRKNHIGVHVHGVSEGRCVLMEIRHIRHSGCEPSGKVKLQQKKKNLN